MRIANPITPARLAQMPPHRNPQPRFGYYVSPPPPQHPHNTSDTLTDTSTNPGSLGGKEVGALMFAIMLGIPAIMFGAYKFSCWYSRRNHNQRLERAHEQMLTEADTIRQADQWSYRMHNVALPANAVVREERNAES